jgi:phospholipase/carboxylesterase
VLVLNGRDDPFTRNGPAVADALAAHGAQVDFRELSAAHELSTADVTEAAEWIRQNLQDTT